MVNNKKKLWRESNDNNNNNEQRAYNSHESRYFVQTHTALKVQVIRHTSICINCIKCAITENGIPKQRIKLKQKRKEKNQQMKKTQQIWERKKERESKKDSKKAKNITFAVTSSVILNTHTYTIACHAIPKTL